MKQPLETLRRTRRGGTLSPSHSHITGKATIDELSVSRTSYTHFYGSGPSCSRLL